MDKKRRKTLDEYLGIKKENTTPVLVVAIFSSIIVGGVLAIVSPILGIYSGYYLWKQRNDKNIPSNTKKLRIALFIIWLLVYGLFQSLKTTSHS